MSVTPAAPAADDLVPLTEPAGGVPDVIETPEAYAAAVAAFAAGTGPVAADAERASGYRYGQHDYLVQLRRAGAGTVLIDPIAVPDLTALGAALVGAVPRGRGSVRTPLHLASLDAGEGGTLVRDLRRREAVDTIVLTQRAGRREMVTLLTGGVRGVVAVEAPGAVLILTRPSQAPATPVLTDRETRVLRLIAEGNTNSAVGERLGISALTVKSHLSRIARKLGTGDRAGMVAVAIRRRLLA